MWTPTTRQRYSRDDLRYETDLTDAEWALIEPLLPEPLGQGRPRVWPRREIMNAIFYVLRGGIAWRLLPTDLPPKSTVFRWFALWRDRGVFEAMNHLLVMPTGSASVMGPVNRSTSTGDADGSRSTSRYSAVDS